MRYAIVSDIHANLVAWNRVLEDIHAVGADTLVCLGDIVGYGPKPQEVLDVLRRDCANFVLGNHDAAVTGQLDASVFNDQARSVVEWTRTQLNPESIEFLRSMPLSIESENILFVHAEAANPGRFSYVEDVEGARESLTAITHRLIFLGHTHHPTGFVLHPDGQVFEIADEDFQLSEGDRYLINVGSAGEPRNPEDIRARYVIFDSDTEEVLFRRVEFDPELYRAHLVSSGLKIHPFFLQVIDHQAFEAAQEHAMVRDMIAPIHTTESQAPPRSFVATGMAGPIRPSRGRASAASRSPARRGMNGKPRSPLFTLNLVLILALLGATGFLLHRMGRIPWLPPSGEESLVLELELESAPSLASAAGESSPAATPPVEPDPGPEFQPVSPEVLKAAVANDSFEAPKVRAGQAKTPANWQLLTDKPVGMSVRNQRPIRPFKQASGNQVLSLSQGTGLLQGLRNVVVQPNADYLFSFSQYEPSDTKNRGSGLRLELWEDHPREGGTLLASQEFGATGAGKTAQREASLSTPGNAILGSRAFIVFREVADRKSRHNSQVVVDHLVLKSVAPSP